MSAITHSSIPEEFGLQFDSTHDPAGHDWQELPALDDSFLGSTPTSAHDKSEQNAVRAYRATAAAAESTINALQLTPEVIDGLDSAQKQILMRLIKAVSTFNVLHRSSGIIESLPPALSRRLHELALESNDYEAFLGHFTVLAEQDRTVYFRTATGKADPAGKTPATRFFRTLLQLQ